MIFWFCQNPGKKGGTVKSGGSKKGEGTAQAKPSKTVEPEDVEVIRFSFENELLLCLEIIEQGCVISTACGDES